MFTYALFALVMSAACGGVVKKCCPGNTVYDPLIRVCREDSNATNTFSEYFEQSTVIEYINLECPRNMAVVDDLSPLSHVLNMTREDHCIDMSTLGNDIWVFRYCELKDIACKDRPCFRKCCPDGESYFDKTCQPDELFSTLDIPAKYDVRDIFTPSKKVTVRGFGVFHNLTCEGGAYPIFPNEEDKFEVHMSGHLMYVNYVGKESVHEHCLENVIDEDNTSTLMALVCFPPQEPEESQTRFDLISAGLIASSVCLLATFLVYACLPALQNLHGKTLMCHVTCLFSANISLVTAQQLPATFHGCAPLGFVMYFCFTAAFSWLNVMCFDIWWTFGVMRAFDQGSRRKRERRRFILYSIYAWLLPTAMTTVVLVLDLSGDIVPFEWKPKVGQLTCWFSATKAPLIYFYLPVSILITCNIVLFVLTARNCSRVKAELHRMQNSMGERCKKKFRSDRNRMIMGMKLFVVMGVTWALEVISAVSPVPQWMFYLTDAANALQGVLIFIIFVLKKKVLRNLGQRLGLKTCFGSKKPRGDGTDRLDTCYDPYRMRKTSSNSTLYTTMSTIVPANSVSKNKT